MIEQINTELLKLQDELGKFDGAVAKITQAGEMTDSLIESSKDLQKSFGEHLNKIQVLFSEYMNKTYNHTEEKIKAIFTNFQERLKQEENILEKFSQLTNQNSDLAQEFIKKSSEETNNHVQRLIDEAQKNFTEEKEFVQLQMSNFQNKVTSMMDSHKEKIKSEQGVLDNYLELADSTAKLSKYLKSVNFPTELDIIKKQVEELKAENLKSSKKIDKLTAENTKFAEKIEKLTNSTAKINANTQKLVDDNTTKDILTKVTKIDYENKEAEILESTKTLKSKISGTKFWVIVILILTILFYASFAFAFFNFFPHFLEDIF